MRRAQRGDKHGTVRVRSAELYAAAGHGKSSLRQEGAANDVAL